MALTADQITAQNFKDFYNGIKQYLNASEHRLTSAELDEIMNIAPGANEGLPVLFDETGGERIVGWYKTSAGKKPVYEKTLPRILTVNANRTAVAHNISNIDCILNCKAYRVDSNNKITETLPSGWEHGFYITSANTNSVVFNRNVNGWWDGEVITYIIQYTKTTDSYQ